MLKVRTASLLLLLIFTTNPISSVGINVCVTHVTHYLALDVLVELRNLSY